MKQDSWPVAGVRNSLIWVFNVSFIAIYWEYAGRGKEWLVAFHMVVGGVVWVRSFPPCFGSPTLWGRLNSAGCGWKGNLPGLSPGWNIRQMVGGQIWYLILTKEPQWKWKGNPPRLSHGWKGNLPLFEENLILRAVGGSGRVTYLPGLSHASITKRMLPIPIWSVAEKIGYVAKSSLQSKYWREAG